MSNRKAKKMSVSDHCLTPKALAARWDITPKTLEKYRKDGIGPRWFSPGDGSAIRYRIQDVEAHEQGLRGAEDLAVAGALEPLGYTLDDVATGNLSTDDGFAVAQAMARAILGYEENEVTHG